MRLALGPRNPCHCTSFCCTPSGVLGAGREFGKISFPLLEYRKLASYWETPVIGQAIT